MDLISGGQSLTTAVFGDINYFYWTAGLGGGHGEHFGKQSFGDAGSTTLWTPL